MKTAYTKPLKVIYYDGEQWCDYKGEPIAHTREERETWEHIVVKRGVKIIKAFTFANCKNVKKITMSSTVKRIDTNAFAYCESLMEIDWSGCSISYIGSGAFFGCISLYSVYIPTPKKRGKIKQWAFSDCTDLRIFVAENFDYGPGVFYNTRMMDSFPLGGSSDDHDLQKWMDHRHDDLPLHRICTSDTPSICRINAIFSEQGIESFIRQDKVGLTSVDYLSINPYADVDSINYCMLLLLMNADGVERIRRNSMVTEDTEQCTNKLLEEKKDPWTVRLMKHLVKVYSEKQERRKINKKKKEHDRRAAYYRQMTVPIYLSSQSVNIKVRKI